MAPIRVGLIGLSGTPPELYEGAGWTPNAHLPYLKASPDYEIVALLNSSVASAEAAIARCDLPKGTKAYGKPDDLAADSNIDLVVCSIRSDRHLDTVRPSIIVGKAVFIEWPLERNLQLAQELASLVAKYKVANIVALQGSYSPEIRMMKTVIGDGKIGKILSSSWVGAFGFAGATEVKSAKHFLVREVGANIVTIGLGHSIDFLSYVLGEFKTYQSLFHVGHSTKDIIDPAANNKFVLKDALNTVPDQLMIQGRVSPSDAIVSIQLHGGNTFPGAPQAVWKVIGEKGELRLTSPLWALNVGHPDSKLELFDMTTGVVETLIPEKDEWDTLPFMAQNIARLYEAHRKKEWYPDFEWAVKRHQMIDNMWKTFDKNMEELHLGH